MDRFNNGLIFTNQKCIACSKCISVCNILGANISVKGNGRNRIIVDTKKCIHCGHCIATCPQDAREYKDDIDSFFSALQGGQKITVLISPTFMIYYQEEAKKIIGYLKAYGVDKVYDATFGTDISVWAHTKYIKDHYNDPPNSKCYIANICPTIKNRIEQYTSHLVNKIIPVQSPLISASIYLHKYFNDSNKIAFIGPCISCHDEIESSHVNNNVDFVITYKHLMQRLQDINLDVYSDDFDPSPIEAKEWLYYHGNFKEYVASFFPEDSYFLNAEGQSQEIFDLLKSQQYSNDPLSQPLMIDLLSCSNGCHGGPGVEENKINLNLLYRKYAEKLNKRIKTGTYEERWEEFSKKFQFLKFEDFTRSYTDKYKQSYIVPEFTLDDIFNTMLKTTKDKRHIDCGSCGYKTCNDMAHAIAYGHNKKENCIHYMNDQLYINYFTDAITGLPNQMSYIKKVNEIMMRNPDKNYAIFQGDVNRLKIINDLYTFPVGNKVLKNIATTLSNAVQDVGICARLGGGTFSIFIERTEENLNKILELNHFDCKHLGIDFPVTVRFGVFSTNENIRDLSMMMNCATLCMDKSISNTQNTFTFYDDNYRNATLKEIDITSKLQKALANHEFTLWFQPQYKSLTGELVGAETLVRWIQSDGTIIMPDAFIPIAEKNGIIRKLDVEIWRLAFKTMHNWIQRNEKLFPISVNISRISLENDSFIYTIMNLARDYDVPPRLIHFEITESAYINDQKNMISRINKLRNLGYQIAMDDFGSGYSSLNTLKDLPIDILKLDMGFLRDQSNMDKGGRIISSLVTMAQNLEYITIAEGVETQEQADFLKSIGVDIIQGFLYSKPVSEKKYLDIISNQTVSVNVEKNVSSSIIEINNFYNPNSSESLMFDKMFGPSAIFEVNPITNKFNLLRVNQKALRIFGLENMSFKNLQHSLKNLFSKESKNIFSETVNKAIVTDSEAVCILKEIENVNNEEIWTKMHISVVSKKEDSYLIYVLIEDLTDEMIAENNLTVSNNYLATLMDNTQVGMCLMNLRIDILNFPESLKIKILKINKHFTEKTLYSEKEVLSWNEKNLLDMIHPIDRPLFIAKALQSFSTGYSKPYSCNVRAKNKRGQYFQTKILVNSVKQEDGSYMLFTTYLNQDVDII